jgi:hypothetical protein
MKTFSMVRNNDESGISGTGKILEGAIYSNGRVIVYWLGKDFNSFGFYDHLFAFHFIHVKSHPTNNTELVFNHELTPEPVKRERRKICRHCKNPYADHPKDRQWEISGLRRSCSGNLVELTDETIEES